MAKKTQLKDGDEITYQMKNNKGSTVWTFEISTKNRNIPMLEEEIILCIESYIHDWFKEKTGSAFDRLDSKLQ